jgi:hypothetical protein
MYVGRYIGMISLVICDKGSGDDDDDDDVKRKV